MTLVETDSDECFVNLDGASLIRKSYITVTSEKQPYWIINTAGATAQYVSKHLRPASYDAVERYVQRHRIAG